MNQNQSLILTVNTALLAAAAVLILLWTRDIELIPALISTHAGLGFLAFAMGGLTLLSKKGSATHVFSGRIFYHAMVVSVAISLWVALLPSHFSPTLFHIAVLSLYFLIGGKRSIRFKSPDHKYTIDQALALGVVLVSLAVMAYTGFIEGRIHPLRTVFGAIGISFGAFDWWLFTSQQHIRRQWLLLHLSKMMGGYTAAVTAFFVAQQVLSGYFNWFGPTVVGVSGIIYWVIKLKQPNPISNT